MKRIVLMGECMAELVGSGPGTLNYGFAGDVINTAVYLKRCFPQLECQLLTAVGRDRLSKEMLGFFQREQLDTQWVCTSTERSPGLYWITTDASGERSFSYWRENSAARELMRLLDEAAMAQLGQADWFYFSGISLAVIPPDYRENFFLMLQRLKRAGVKLAFDSNYRARLWPNADAARACFDWALALVNLVFAGVEDFQLLYPHSHALSIKDQLAVYQHDELVIKNGGKDIVVVMPGFVASFPVEPVTQVIDTTSAGDAFNGAYLGARIAGRQVPVAIKFAAACAALVIQHQGAIICPQVFQQFFSNQALAG